MNLGNIYQDIHNYEKAIHNFQIVLREDPYHADAYFNLGLAYQNRALGKSTSLMKIADLKSALSCYENVIRIEPTLADAKTAADYVRNLIRVSPLQSISS
jgi:tetratricopeptide (TPR) repeat protein